MKNFEQLAEMSKLTFTPEEETKIRTELENIVKFVSVIEKSKISVQAQTDCNPVVNLDELRDDVVRPSLDIEQTHKNTRRRNNRFFVVPQVVE